MQPLKTYFDQIPVAVVKKIVGQISGREESPDRIRHESDFSPEDWREVAKKVQRETDSGKMIELVQEMIARYDAETEGKRASSQETRKRTGSPEA